jgi:hypothetical protein
MPKDHAIASGSPPMPHVRDAIDADSHEGLRENPGCEDAKLDVALDSSFPTSDAPANTHPGSGEPAPSSGYDEAAEKALARKASRRAMARKLARPLLLGAFAVTVVGIVSVVLSARRRDETTPDRTWAHAT